MARMPLIQKIRWGIRQFKTQGIVKSIRHGLRLLNLNPTGYYYYFQIRQNSKRESKCARPNPFKILWISPNQIEKVSMAQFHKWRDAGRVCAGDWDQHVRPFTETRVYRSLEEHFINDLPWEDTDIYSWSIDRIDQGKHGWQMCTSRSELDDRCTEVDELYNRMRDRGYRSWEELTGQNVKNVIKSRKFGTHKTDIAVHIDRNGEFLFVDGRHRLSIAKLLRIEAVAVRVIVRHREWQTRREAGIHTYRNEGKTSVHNIDHKDIQTLLSDVKCTS